MPVENSHRRSALTRFKTLFQRSKAAADPGSRPVAASPAVASDLGGCSDSLQSSPRDVNPPAPVAPLYPLPPLPAPKVNWARAEVLERSKDGVHAGVYFVRDGGDIVVVKPSTTISQEVFVAELAAMVGLHTPSLRVDSSVPKNMKRRMHADDQAHASMVSMRLIRGRNFGELTDIDQARVLGRHAPGGHGAGVLSELGRVLAFDYLLQNPDRFPCAGLDGNNPGNLMIDHQGDLHAIDTTLPWLIAEKEAHTYQRRLGEVLRLSTDPGDALARRHLSGLKDFFPERWAVSWEDIADDVVAGFRQQTAIVGDLPAKKLRGLLDKAKLSPQHRAALQAQLEIFRQRAAAHREVEVSEPSEGARQRACA